MKFKAEDLRDALWNNESDSGLRLVESTLLDHDRWSLQYAAVFSFEGKHYRAGYSQGATEQQDERPFEDEDEVDCEEVKAEEYTATRWVPVKRGRRKVE